MLCCQRAEIIGYVRGIFDETNGRSHQLCVREARRMKPDYVVTQKDLLGDACPDEYNQVFSMPVLGKRNPNNLAVMGCKDSDFLAGL